MNDEQKTTQNDITPIGEPQPTTPAPVTPVTSVAPAAPSTKRHVSFIGKDRPQQGRARKGGKPAPRKREGSEYAQRIIDIRRVARVVAGGRRFNFSVAIVLGDKNGSVGVGLGKGADTALAIDKAAKDAKKHMIKLPLTKERSIPRETFAKYASAQVFLKPAKGRGLVAGSSVRSVLDLGGVTDINAKIFSRSKNKLNNARATLLALKKLS